MPCLEQNVFGLDVAVDDVLRVRVGERFGNIAGNRHGLRNGKLALARQALSQRFAFDIGHCVEQEPIRDIRVEQRQDVGMCEPGGNLDLVEKAVGTENGGDVRPEDLQGDKAIAGKITGEIHD